MEFTLWKNTYSRSELFNKKTHIVKVTVPYYFLISLLCWWHKGVNQELHCHGNSPAVKRTSFEVLTLYYRARVGAMVSKLSLLQIRHTDMNEASRNMTFEDET